MKVIFRLAGYWISIMHDLIRLMHGIPASVVCPCRRQCSAATMNTAITSYMIINQFHSVSNCFKSEPKCFPRWWGEALGRGVEDRMGQFACRWCRLELHAAGSREGQCGCNLCQLPFRSRQFVLQTAVIEQGRDVKHTDTVIYDAEPFIIFLAHCRQLMKGKTSSDKTN